MKTRNLIDGLVADQSAKAMPVGNALVFAVALGATVAAMGFLAVFGVRPDAALALETWRFPTKLAIQLILAAGAGLLAYQLVIPGRNPQTGYLALAVAPALLVTTIAIEMMVMPQSTWADRAIGTNSRICLTVIPLLSIPLLAGALWALRQGAAISPMGVGAIAGLYAGATAAFLYGTHCADDSPFFVALWYTCAIGLVTAAGALLGRRVLAW